MILNLLFDFGIWVFELISSYLPSTAPVLYSFSNTFYDILQFGVWVIGDGMWMLFVTTITGWLSFKCIWGIVLFIYRLIPII